MPLIGLLIGLVAAGLICLLLLAVLNHEQLKLVLILFPFIGFFTTLPVIAHRVSTIRKVIQSLREQDGVGSKDSSELKNNNDGNQ